MGTIKNRRRKTKWDKTENELQGTRDRTDHLLERISGIEDAIVRLHGAKCPCGSREVVNKIDMINVLTGKEIGQSYGIEYYKWGEARCFYCHTLLEAYGVMSDEQSRRVVGDDFGMGKVL